MDRSGRTRGADARGRDYESLRREQRRLVDGVIEEVCKVAGLLANSFQSQNHVRFSTLDVSRLIVEAVKVGRIKLADLKGGSLRDKIKKALQETSATSVKKNPD